jgi:hypothetical protein
MAKESNMLDSDEVEVQENTLVVSGTGKVGRISMSMDDAPYIIASNPVEPVDVYSSLCSRIATLERQVEDYEEKFKKIDTLYELLVNEG